MGVGFSKIERNWSVIMYLDTSEWTINRKHRQYLYLNEDTMNSIIKNLPETINKNLDLSDMGIKVLEGLPKIVKGDLDLSNNKIKSLKGLPEIVTGDLWLNNNKIKIIDFPENIIIGGSIYLEENEIKSFKGLPEFVGEV